VKQSPSAAASTRIALVSDSLYLGGSSTFLCNFAGELVRRNIPTEVLSLHNAGPLAADFARLNIPVRSMGDRPRIFEDRLRSLLLRLKDFRPTVVAATLSPSSFEVLRYMPAGVFRVGVGQSDEPRVYNSLATYVRHMDMLAVVSPTMKRKAEALPEFTGVPVCSLPYGVPIPEAGRLPARKRDRPLRILYLGRLYREQKRVQLFPTILDQLRSSGIPFHWTIAGDGPERTWLEQAMRNTGPEQTVSFTGPIPYSDILPLLFAHDVFLLASDYEGLPLSLLEAMGCGLVPVVSDLPSSIGEVVNETTGKLVAPDNISGYAGSIVWLHGHRAEMRQLSQNARERVRREYSVAAMTDRWLTALPQVPRSEISWPKSTPIRPILSARNKWRFSPPMRVVRRAFVRFRR
jgi:glycosyltransferase involved in cell wall biosynthesis